MKMEKQKKTQHLNIRVTESQLRMINNYINENNDKNLSEMIRRCLQNYILENKSKNI